MQQDIRVVEGMPGKDVADSYNIDPEKTLECLKAPIRIGAWLLNQEPNKHQSAEEMLQKDFMLLSLEESTLAYVERKKNSLTEHSKERNNSTKISSTPKIIPIAETNSILIIIPPLIPLLSNAAIRANAKHPKRTLADNIFAELRVTKVTG